MSKIVEFLHIKLFQ